jgi:GNAT superfamily N-acetyltransferase
MRMQYWDYGNMDMLIKLYDLPSQEAFVEQVTRQHIVIRRAMAYERSTVCDWVRRHFNPLWAEECAVAFGHQPIGCYIAVKDDALCGFCCLNATYRNFIGPIGIASSFQSKGVGRSLLLTAAEEMHRAGFAYAVIGDAGEPGFFKRAARAVEIPDSTPGSYPPKLT